MDDPSRYLQESGQIKITGLVQEHAQKANAIEINQGKDAHPNLQKAYKVSKYMYQLPNIDDYIQKPKNREEIQKNHELKNSLFRKRTLHEILEQGVYPTCSDEGIVFRGLMVALSVSTAYVEAFHEDYLLGKKFHGHVMGKIQLGDKWYYIDPKNNQRRVVKTEQELFPLVVYREGLDSWDIGIKGYDDMHKAKRENTAELMEKYKKMLSSIYNAKIKLADGIIKNPDLADLSKKAVNSWEAEKAI